MFWGSWKLAESCPIIGSDLGRFLDWSIRDLAFAKDGSFLAALVWTKAANKGKGGSSVSFVEIRRPRP